MLPCLFIHGAEKQQEEPGKKSVSKAVEELVLNAPELRAGSAGNNNVRIQRLA